MKKLVAMLLTLMMVCSVMALAAADDSDLAYVQGKGTLVVGITDFAPMDYKDADGNWIGFDADLARAFGEKLGVTVEFIEIDWDNKILELNAKTVDCIWNGMTLTDEVNAAMSCTATYLNNSQVIVMSADKLAEMPEEATTEDFAALSFAVEAGSAGEEVATDLGFNVTPVTSQAAALMEVSAGTSDACVIDLLMAMAMTGEGTGYANLDYGYELNEESYVIGFRTGSDLTALCDEFLAAAAEDGTIEALTAKYIVGE